MVFAMCGVGIVTIFIHCSTCHDRWGDWHRPDTLCSDTPG